MIRIIDYGVGNIQAFLTMFKGLGILSDRATSPCDLVDATHIILPGVGHFDRAMRQFNASGMRSTLEDMVMVQRVPVLGICVGMQMLAEGSEEGNLPGLNWIPGRVRAFSKHPAAATLPMPHMGWNVLKPEAGAKLFEDGLRDSPQFYFLHSFYFDAQYDTEVAARAYYGMDFAAAVARGHILGVQCHPEKSHRWGAQLLRNFAEL
jgi:glutamine amidotransferase